MKAAGYKWAVLELDDYGNDQRWGPFHHALRSEGLLPGVWFTEGGNIEFTPGDAAFAIAELEGQGDYDGIVRCINEDKLPACPKAVCTNFNVPINPSNGLAEAQAAAAPLVAHFDCLTEAYMGDNPNATPDNLNHLAVNLGWSHSQPVFGVYNKPLNEYAPWHDWSGWSAYLAEYLPL